MRVNQGLGLIKQVSCEVGLRDHKILRQFAEEQGRSVNEIIRQWIMPKIRRLKVAETKSA